MAASILPSSIRYRLQYQHEALDHILAGLPAEAFWVELVPGKWTIQQQLAHLGRYQIVFEHRYLEMTERETPVFAPYRAEQDDDFTAWATRSVPEIMEALRMDRARISQTILELPAEVFTYKATHPTFGTLALLDLVEMFLLHEAHHQYAIFKMVKRP